MTKLESLRLQKKAIRLLDEVGNLLSKACEAHRKHTGKTSGKKKAA